jgi:hypothetical protein
VRKNKIEKLQKVNGTMTEDKEEMESMTTSFSRICTRLTERYNRKSS